MNITEIGGWLAHGYESLGHGGGHCSNGGKFVGQVTRQPVGKKPPFEIPAA
jgi:hypothetical protein